MNAQALKWHSISIKANGPDARGTVLCIDGEPLKGVRAFRITGHVDSLIELTLEMLPGSIEVQCEYAMVTKATTNEGPHQG